MFTENKHPHIDARNFLFVHFFIYSIGLVGISKFFATAITSFLFGTANLFVNYSDWAQLGGTPTKPAELLYYALAVIGLFFYYLITLLLVTHLQQSESIRKFLNTKRIVIYIYFGLSIVLNIALLKASIPFNYLLSLIWVVFLLAPMASLLNKCVTFLSGRAHFATIVALVLLVISLGVAFQPYLNGGFPLSNDYMDIPEQTILNIGVVDNTNYINTNGIGGLKKHDPRLPKSEWTMKSGTFLKLTPNKALAKLAQDEPTKFSYQLDGLLVVKELINDSDFARLTHIVSNRDDTLKIEDFYYNQFSKTKKYYSQEEIEFVKKNRRELLDQSLAGHFFHHQNTMLGTINEYVLGKPQNQIVFLYGWLSTVVIAETMKALGGITFENYQKAFYFFYPAYYLLVLIAAAILFKARAYVLLTASISLGSLYLIGFEYIRFAPGFNPIRHFFDVVTLVFLYWYFFKPDKNFLYFCLAALFAFVGMLLNKEFGLVLLLSMIATVAIKSLSDRKILWGEFAVLILVLGSSIAFFSLFPTAKNPTLVYVLLGVAAPKMAWMKIAILLIILSSGYMILLKSTTNWRFLALFWFLYMQGLLIYYVWNPAPNHLTSLGSVYALCIVLLVKCLIISNQSQFKNEKKILFCANFFSAMLIFLPGMLFYWWDQHNYKKVFNDHVVHQWNFPSAKFQSTMEPFVFENAVSLISKYSSGHSIYLLSKYDNILPFLSGKYNAMPYTELSLSLVTQKEIENCVAIIRRSLPLYLFVDTDMNRSYLGDIFEEEDPVTKLIDTSYDASRGRARVLENFGKVFAQVEGMYEPIEVGNLITVYKRRAGT